MSTVFSYFDSYTCSKICWTYFSDLTCEVELEQSLRPSGVTQGGDSCFHQGDRHGVVCMPFSLSVLDGNLQKFGSRATFARGIRFSHQFWASCSRFRLMSNLSSSSSFGAVSEVRARRLHATIAESMCASRLVMFAIIHMKLWRACHGRPTFIMHNCVCVVPNLQLSINATFQDVCQYIYIYIISRGASAPLRKYKYLLGELPLSKRVNPNSSQKNRVSSAVQFLHACLSLYRLFLSRHTRSGSFSSTNP